MVDNKLSDWLQIKNLSVSLPNNASKLFSNFNLSLNDSQTIVGLIGKNGIGKTVLAKIIAGLYKPNNGQIIINGHNISQLKASKRVPYISMTFQKATSAFFNETVFKELVFVLKSIKKQQNSDGYLELIPKLLKDIGFQDKHNQNPLTLSGGEKRKLSHLVLSLMNSSLTILDEPTTGLDKLEINDLISFIKSLSDNNQKVIVITHNIQFLLQITKYIVILHQNQLCHTIVGYQGALDNQVKLKLSVDFPEINFI